MQRTAFSLVFFVAASAASLVACPGNDPPPVVPTPESDAGNSPVTSSGGLGSTASNACTAAGGACVPLSLNACPSGHLDWKNTACGAPLSAACCMPGPDPLFGGGGGNSGTASGTAQVLDPNLAALATVPLGAYAASEAPGMAKNGAIVAANFQEGQTLESTFTLEPGKCYTLVATGAGIQQLDLEMQYVTPLPGIAPTIARSTQKGFQASIGAKDACLKPMSPFPAQAKFVVRSTKGAGVAAAQLYSK